MSFSLPKEDLNWFWGQLRSKVNAKFGLWTLQNFRTITLLQVSFDLQWWYSTHVLPVIGGANLLILGSKVKVKLGDFVATGGFFSFRTSFILIWNGKCYVMQFTIFSGSALKCYTCDSRQSPQCGTQWNATMPKQFEEVCKANHNSCKKVVIQMIHTLRKSHSSYTCIGYCTVYEG